MEIRQENLINSIARYLRYLTIAGYFFSCLALIILGVPTAVFAESIPPGDNPGAQAARFREDVERQKKKFVKKKKPPKVEIRIDEDKFLPRDKPRAKSLR